ncbi:MAG: formate--tetrahydrofolate ligase [bacterium]
MKSDIEIAHEAKMLPVNEIGAMAGLKSEDLMCCGDFKAKIQLDSLARFAELPDAPLVLVTSMNPTSAGEGKTTTSVGLAQALNRLGEKAIVTLREPSLGPVFGVKGGAAGGGYSQVLPMEDINLHFTGDMHAVTSAHNLLSAMLDNHIYRKNRLRIHVNAVVYRRAVDLNDRVLRKIAVGLGGRGTGIPREDGYDITAASEVMAILALASDYADLKERISRIIVAYDMDDNPVTARDLKAQGAMCALLRDALKPNLVQTMENTPAVVHAGPFGNIAHGTNSIIATRAALKLGDIVVTEAGFGADLGAEKFLDIVSRVGDFYPRVVVLVVSARALKMHGGAGKSQLARKDLRALKQGMCNLEKHVENLTDFGLPPVVAINVFSSDSDEEIELMGKHCKTMGLSVAASEAYEKGGEGALELAEKVLERCKKKAPIPRPVYAREAPLKEKIELIARKVYGADGVNFEGKSSRLISKYEGMGFGHSFICMAKTQYSLSHDPDLLGRPRGWRLAVTDVRLSAGADFVVPVTGDIMTMPGLPGLPAAERIDIDESGKISGLS